MKTTVTEAMLTEEIDRNKQILRGGPRAFGTSAIYSEIKLAEKALVTGDASALAFAHNLLVRNRPQPIIRKGPNENVQTGE